MKKYSSENSHNFTNRLFNSINAYGVENITMDKNRNFTAIVEAVEYNDNEQIEPMILFTEKEIEARMILSNKIKIPFYLIAYKLNVFYIFECIKQNDTYVFVKQLSLNEEGFIKWWCSFKKQNKLMN